MRYFLIFLLCSATYGSSLAQTDLRADSFCPAEGPVAIEFEIVQPGAIRLDIKHIFTEIHVRTLVLGQLAAGRHQVMWDGRDDAGQLMDTGLYIVVLSGSDWQLDTMCAIDCGNDLAFQEPLVVGGKNVGIPIALTLESDVDTDLAIFAADGVTRVSTIYQQPSHGGQVVFYWLLEDSLRAPLPAGDYICRLVSPPYSEDIPVTLDPITRSEMTATVTNTHGDQVTCIDYQGGTPPLIKGPLQQVTVDFGRRMSAAEMDFLLGGGLRTTGCFRHATPTFAVVAIDSTSVTFTDFSLNRTWPDIYGIGLIDAWGFFSATNTVFQLGYDFQGITWLGPACQSTGPTDTTDWVVNPGPFYDSAHGTVSPPCTNPIPVGGSARISYDVAEFGWVGMQVVNSDGVVVRHLVTADRGAGPHSVTWDRLDHDGVEVPEGIYRLIWSASRVDNEAVIVSGDILVSSAVSAVPEILLGKAIPALIDNHPNPFNPTTSISFDLPQAEKVRLTVFSVAGKHVATLLAGPLASGRHSIAWHGRDDQGRTVSSGAYFYRLEAGGITDTRPMMLLK